MDVKNRSAILMAVLLVLIGFLLYQYGPIEFAQKKDWVQLEGENNIKDIRVIKNDGNNLIVEVDYFYNGRRVNNQPEIQQTICMHVYTKSNNLLQSSSSDPTNSCSSSNKKILVGDQSATLKINRARGFAGKPDVAFSTTHLAVVMGSDSKNIYKPDDIPKKIEKEIPLQAAWNKYLPFIPDGVNKENIAELVDRAESYIDSEEEFRWGHAKEILDEVLLYDPEYSDAYVQMARYELTVSPDKNGIDKALRILKSAIKINQDHVDTMSMLSHVYLWEKNSDQAIKWLKKVDEKGTNNLWHYVNWASLYSQQGEDGQAIRTLEKVVNTARPHNKYDRAIRQAYRQLIPIYQARNDDESKEKVSMLYRKRINDFPEEACFPLYYANYTLSHRDDQYIEEAVSLAEKSMGMKCKEKYFNSKILSVAYLGRYYLMSEKEKLENKTLVSKAASIYPYPAYLFDYMSRTNKASRYIDILLDEGVDINTKDENGNTALLLVTQDNDITAVRNLLKKRSDINIASDTGGVTALMIAVIRSNIELIELLLHSGADINIRDMNGMTARDWADRIGNKNVIDLLGEKTRV